MATRKDSDKSNHDSSDTGGNRSRIGGSKLARRARSFKDDFIDKISSIRSPGSTNSGSRSNSPKAKPRNRPKLPDEIYATVDFYDSVLDNSLKDLEGQVKQMQIALRYFQDVISKNKLEMLPGNGTIVLETVANIHTILKSYTVDEQNSTVVSGLNQVYQSLAHLLKLCDDLLIDGDKSLDKEHVADTVNQVENAVQNLVLVANDKITERENRSVQSESSTSSRCSTVSSDPSHYRVSLPEIAMSPHERQLLEQTTQTVLERHILSRTHADNEEMPPPKPPLPENWLVDESPPPLPPKKRNLNSQIISSSMPVVPASLSLEGLSLQSDSSVGSFEGNGGMLKFELLNEECASKRDSHDRYSSSSSSVRSARNLSSHYIIEHQQQQQQQHQHQHQAKRIQTSASFSTVDGVAMTTMHNEIRLTSTSMMSTFPLSKEGDDDLPPALPLKMKRAIFKPDYCLNNIRSKSSLNDGFVGNGPHSGNGSPPPLPLKKKHIMAYMEMFGNCSHSTNTEFLQRSVDTYNLWQAEWQNHDMMLNSSQSCSLDMFRNSSPNFNNSSAASESSSPPPILPPRRIQLCSITSSQSPTSTLTPTSPVPPPPPPPPPPTLPLLQSQPHSIEIEEKIKSPQNTSPLVTEFLNGVAYSSSETEAMGIEGPDPLAELDVSQWLVFRRADEEGPSVRGGHPDALIVLATKANKNEDSNTDFLYQEAFLTTYRTFISPIQLIEKLIHRYQRFDIPSDPTRQRAAKEAFSLLVRIIGDLTIMDLDEQVVKLLTEFIYQLIRNGDLLMGKALRKKWLEKYQAKLQFFTDKLSNGALASQNIYTRQSTLLDFKSEHLAEQMTLLDAELFNSIEIPEVLIWTQEQNEERSPNLTRFTEHFNKMSYWARSRILEQNDAKDRERYVTKFIKIMKHLRKMNNFNSYLALLSALDSAPVRRLEWQKHITDGLTEYCALIDSSSSFRAYRQALAETQPPCIPYIGLVLQDLTFVHIGNSDYLNDGVINFSKRWQQFNIVENMKRFKKVSYNFRAHERIVAFFSNFDEFLCEEAMWQISESIKPRGSKKAVQK